MRIGRLCDEQDSRRRFPPDVLFGKLPAEDEVFSLNDHFHAFSFLLLRRLGDLLMRQGPLDFTNVDVFSQLWHHELNIVVGLLGDQLDQ